MLTPVHHWKSQQWAWQHQNWNTEQWKKEASSDEWRLLLHGACALIYGIRKYYGKKSSRGSVLLGWVWASLAAKRGPTQYYPGGHNVICDLCTGRWESLEHASSAVMSQNSYCKKEKKRLYPALDVDNATFPAYSFKNNVVWLNQGAVSSSCVPPHCKRQSQASVHYYIPILNI